MNLSNVLATFRGKRLLLTGHTGFKGSWLAEWLLQLGAEVHGLALDPPTSPALFDQLALGKRLHDHRVDIRDAAGVRKIAEAAQPDFVFHLAAQPLVRHSYAEPLETMATNIMGTAHLLDALRFVDRPVAAVMVTTDKCYENREWSHAYREEDPMGGYDPYSASKGAAEILIASYRRAFFSSGDSPVRVASARAGNVIGGGDWALDRIVPDAIRALRKGEPIEVRMPEATRPWQHVLEPLSGYLTLAARLAQSPTLSPQLSAFNFGPALPSNRPVRDLIETVLTHWEGEWQDVSRPDALHEAGRLNLATDKAFHLLEWQPRWNFETTVEKTVEWYREVDRGSSPLELTQQQIAAYSHS